MTDANRMSAAEFHRRVSALGIRSRGMLAPLHVLRDGASIRGQARECGMDPTALLRMVRRIRDARICEHCGQAIRPSE